MLDVPDSVRFDAGATTVEFTARVIENDFVGTNATMTVTARSDIYISDSVMFEIEDNDTPTLSLTLDSTGIARRCSRDGRTAGSQTHVNEVIVSIGASQAGVLDLPPTVRFRGRSNLP